MYARTKEERKLFVYKRYAFTLNSLENFWQKSLRYNKFSREFCLKAALLPSKTCQSRVSLCQSHNSVTN